MPESKKSQTESKTSRKASKPLNRAIERYIRTIVHMRLKAARQRDPHRSALPMPSPLSQGE